jgi:hypothetical protein
MMNLKYRIGNERIMSQFFGDLYPPYFLFLTNIKIEFIPTNF